jgi:hypothetical protein
MTHIESLAEACTTLTDKTELDSMNGLFRFLKSVVSKEYIVTIEKAMTPSVWAQVNKDE